MGDAVLLPCFYSSVVMWSCALGDVPIGLCESARERLSRTSVNTRFWSGAEAQYGRFRDSLLLDVLFPGLRSATPVSTLVTVVPQLVRDAARYPCSAGEPRLPDSLTAPTAGCLRLARFLLSQE